MELYQIIKENQNLIICLLSILGIRKILLILLLKILFKKASIKQIESFVKNTRTTIFPNTRKSIEDT